MAYQDEEQARYERGKALMDELSDGRAGDLMESLKDVSPKLVREAAAWGFGEIYSRPQLGPRDRQLFTIGMLTALGDCGPQLRLHIGMALNAGLTPVEIVEALLQSAGYCGFPRAINATLLAKEVFAERNLLPVEGAE